jgi:hypothetical protein
MENDGGVSSVMTVGTMVVESSALPLADPPPVTMTALICGEVAVALTFTVTVISG